MATSNATSATAIKRSSSFPKPLKLPSASFARNPLAPTTSAISVSFERIGDLQRDLGNGDQAQQFFSKALEIRERLVRQEPSRADYLRDLSVSYNKMGDLQRALGNGDQAQQFFSKALEIAERLVHQEPSRADYLTDLVVSLSRINTPEATQRALDILYRLRAEAKLTAPQLEWIPQFESKLPTA